jgi:very-short-patch-repair endonuclease
VPERRGRKIKMTSNNHNYYNKILKPYASENRKQMTKAEACLWKYALRAKQMGYTFNRQRPVLNYIADFMCKDLKLIIEVDGGIHSMEEVAKNDIIRQQQLELVGFKVIRFKNEEVLKEINNVRENILATIHSLKEKE